MASMTSGVWTKGSPIASWTESFHTYSGRSIESGTVRIGVGFWGVSFARLPWSTMSNQYEQAHAAERAAAKKMELGNHRVALIIAIVVWVAYLVLPYAGPAHGWEALQLGTTDDGVRISIMETVSAWFSLVGIGVLTTLTVATRRTNFALAAWMMVTISFSLQPCQYLFFFFFFFFLTFYLNPFLRVCCGI